MADMDFCHSCTLQPATVKCRECNVHFCTNCKEGHLRLPMCTLHTMDLIQSMDKLSLQNIQDKITNCKEESVQSANDWKEYSHVLSNLQSDVLQRINQSEADFVHAVKHRYSVIREEVTKAFIFENQKCADVISTVELKCSDIDELMKSVNENASLARSNSKSHDILSSTEESCAQLLQQLSKVPKPPRQPLSVNLDLGQALEELGRSGIVVNNKIPVNSPDHSNPTNICPYPSAPILELNNCHGATGSYSSFSPPYPTHDGFAQIRDTAPVHLSPSKQSTSTTKYQEAEPHPPSYEQATASAGAIAGSVSEPCKKTAITSYMNLMNFDFNCTRRNTELEKEALKMALINDELWLITSKGKIDVLNPITLHYSHVICPGVNYKKYQCKGVVQAGNGNIIMASMAGLFEISQNADILKTISTEGRFLDVTVDSANGNMIYAMSDTKPYHFIVPFSYDVHTRKWEPKAVLEMTNMKTLFPKILVHKQNVYVTKNQFVASNHLYVGYCDIHGQTKEIAFQAIKKDIFKDNPRLCGIDPLGNVFLGDWGDSRMFRVLTPDNAIYNLSVEKSATYVQDGIFLNDKHFVVLSTSYPSKIYGIEGRLRGTSVAFTH